MIYFLTMSLARAAGGTDAARAARKRSNAMTAIVCDSCKKPVAGARREFNYFTILDKDLCETCHDELKDATKQQMRARQLYSFKEYYETLTKNLGRMTGR
jgi:hypothetical protein